MISFVRRATRLFIIGAAFALMVPCAASAQAVNSTLPLPPAALPANAFVLENLGGGLFARLANTEPVTLDDLSGASLYLIGNANDITAYRTMDNVMAPAFSSACWQNNGPALRHLHYGEIRTQVMPANGHLKVRAAGGSPWLDKTPRYVILVVSRCDWMCRRFRDMGSLFGSNWSTLQGTYLGDTSYIDVTADQTGARSSYDTAANHMADRNGRSVLLIPVPESFDSALTVSKQNYLGCSEPSGDDDQSPLRFSAVLGNRNTRGQMACYMLPRDLIWALKRLND